MRVAAAALAGAAGLACAGAAPEPASSGGEGVCEVLAREFGELARERDGGAVREVLEARERRDVSPTGPKSDELLRYRLERIDFVYDRPGWSPARITAFVRDNCIVGPQDRPVLYLPRT